jgi:fermentation-respiration switch protein FrsA (DUF1100 family)
MGRVDIEFSSEGTTCRGWLFLPEGDGPFSAGALAGGWCYVRELVMPYYAQAFAEAGIAALVFDYRNLGVSDGEPRQHLDPWAQIRDYRNALSLLERRAEAPLYQNRSTVESVDLLLEYDVLPFARRIYDTPSLMIVAESDDLTMWDLEIGAFNAIPTSKKKLVTLPHTTHMTLYSDQAKLAAAAAHATSWLAEHLLP